MLGFTATEIWVYWTLFCVCIFQISYLGAWNSRTPNPELDRKYPWFRSLGEERWNYWTMLLQAFTIFPIKFAFFMFAVLNSGLCHMCLGRVTEESYYKRRISAFSLWFSSHLLLKCLGFKFEKRQCDYDYSKWLGPDWREELDEFLKTKQPATYVPNHSGLFDIFVVMSAFYGMTSFVSGTHMKRVPCFAQAIDAGDSIYCERGASKQEAIDKVNEIAKRQTEIQDKLCDRKPLVIFAEGLCTNGSGIAKFKRGAFESLTAVTPCVIRQHASTVYVGVYSSNDHVTMITAMCTMKPSKVIITEMTPFVPNEYLFRQNPDKPKWEAFADAVREAMCEQSGLVKANPVFSEVKEYVKIMQGSHGWAPWSRNFK